MAMAELQIPGDQECPPHAAAVDRASLILMQNAVVCHQELGTGEMQTPRLASEIPSTLSTTLKLYSEQYMQAHAG